VYHFNVPKKSDPPAKMPLHVIPLNMTLTTIDDIVSIPSASKSRYLQYDEEEWVVYVTGGNKSCFGRCAEVDLTWNESVPLLAAMQKRSGSPKLRIGQIDCEKESVLCTGWAATMPSVYHFSVPKKSDPQEKVPLHVVPLNMTLTTVDDIVSIPTASKSRYLQYEEYTGMLHPFDGWVAQFGLLKPFGYFMWGVGNVPSWAMMLIISFVSRNIMSRRMTGGGKKRK